MIAISLLISLVLTKLMPPNLKHDMAFSPQASFSMKLQIQVCEGLQSQLGNAFTKFWFLYFQKIEVQSGSDSGAGAEVQYAGYSGPVIDWLLLWLAYVTTHSGSALGMGYIHVQLQLIL